MSGAPLSDLPPIAWGPDGLVPVVIVDAQTQAVLTLAYANREALERTLASHSTWLYSRSRAELWHKGATSGHTQRVVSVAADCDADALVYRVIPAGPACHTGRPSCFAAELQLERAVADPRAQHGRELEAGAQLEDAPEAGARPDGASEAGARPNGASEASGAGGASDAGGAGFAGALAGLAETIAERKRTPTPDSYTAKLFAGGVDRIGKKIGEEATEVVIAAKNADRGELIWETADLLYHTLVLLAERQISLDEVGAELTRRATPAS